ncbi:MAG: hypothetical protein ACPGFB_09260 [Verrucomicrobiales bacterium]
MDIRTEDYEDLEKLEVIHLSPLKKNCSVKAFGVVWMPYHVNLEPQLGSCG